MRTLETVEKGIAKFWQGSKLLLRVNNQSIARNNPFRVTMHYNDEAISRWFRSDTKTWEILQKQINFSLNKIIFKWQALSLHITSKCITSRTPFNISPHHKKCTAQHHEWYSIAVNIIKKSIIWIKNQYQNWITKQSQNSSVVKVKLNWFIAWFREYWNLYVVSDCLKYALTEANIWTSAGNICIIVCVMICLVKDLNGYREQHWLHRGWVKWSIAIFQHIITRLVDDTS